MNFLSSLAKGAGGESTDETKKPAGEGGSTTELFASAKVLAEAAQTGKYDEKKVAEAAADVLDAGQKYGKLDETKGVGQYVEKAETYLHQYGSKTDAAAAAPAGEKPPVAAPETEVAKPPETEVAKPPAPADKEESKGEGASDYLKMAGDFLGKK